MRLIDTLQNIATNPFKASMRLALIFLPLLVAIGAARAIDSDSVLMTMNKFRQCIQAIDTQAIDSILMTKFRQCLHPIGTQVTDTFDKAAYLDLNTEYNPSVVNKKDSKTTTFLKEVGGTLRNALGTTDSDNAGALSHKISSGLKNQAINKASEVINDKTNQFVNQFGTGRSEIKLHGLNSKQIDYSIKTIQPISSLDENSKHLTFLQAQLTSGEHIEGRRTTVNLGIGHRILVDNDMAIVGANLFHDYESKSAHERLSLGLEYQRTNFGISANVYRPLSDKKTIVEDTLQAKEGFAAGSDTDKILGLGWSEQALKGYDETFA